jgi:flagellar biosynthesis activator protein FlaF
MHESAAAYARTAKTTLSGRDLEAQLLLRAAAKLTAVHDGWPTTSADLDLALVFNRKLWTVFATSATRPDYPLPSALKANIANLAVFIFNRQFEIEKAPAPEKLRALISINREVATGLRTRAPAQGAPAPMPASA